nr:MAG TPA: hypothetical protein [Caudoviricetes sp.]
MHLYYITSILYLQVSIHRVRQKGVFHYGLFFNGLSNN